MTVVYMIVNVLIFILLAPLFEGVIRKITAKVQSRQGPPVTQPYFDILKLLGKENIDSAGTWTFRIAPVLALSSILTVVAIIPFGRHANFLTQYADVISVIYLLTFGGVSVLLGALSSRNTYALIGASREMITMIMVEPVLAMLLIIGAVKVKTLGITEAIAGISSTGYGISVAIMIIVYIMALQAFVGRQPFDIPEAEIEILEGPYIEYSGPNYALFKYYIIIKQMFYAALFVMAFNPIASTGYYAADILIQLCGMFFVYVLIALVGSTNPRFRIDQAIKYYAVLIILSLGAISLSAYGM
jgi:formate hydrogenlyase subunit 4